MGGDGRQEDFESCSRIVASSAGSGCERMRAIASSVYASVARERAELSERIGRGDFARRKRQEGAEGYCVPRE